MIFSQVVLVGVRQPGEVVAENVGIERPVGMLVRFTEIGVAFQGSESRLREAS